MATLPDFTDPAWHRARSDAEMAVSIATGKERMPEFGSRFSDRQVAELVKLVRSFNPSGPADAARPPDEFEARFRKLSEEWHELRRQYRALCPSPGGRTSNERYSPRRPTAPVPEIPSRDGGPSADAG